MPKARLITAVALSVFLAGLLRTECIWQRVGGTILPLMTIVIGLAFILASVRLVSSISYAIRNRSQRGNVVILPAFVYLVAIFDSVANPLGIDCVVPQSPIVERACYEGTMVTRTLLMRENGTFHSRSIGAFGFSNFQSGGWLMVSDTLKLTFSTERPVHMARMYVERGDTLQGIAEGGTRSNPPYFLAGPCRGEN